MLQLGEFKLPTFGDLVNGGEAMIGNVVEGLIEGVTGEKVELTPGNGVDNTRVEGAKGKGEIKFEQKLATLDDQEKLRREVEQKLTKIQTEVTKLKMKQQSERQLRPAVTGPGQRFAPPTQMMGGGGQQQLPILLALTRAVPGLAHDPFILMSLMQQMGNGSFGGMDPMAFAAMQALSGVFAPQPVVRALNAAPQPNPIVTIPQPNPTP